MGVLQTGLFKPCCRGDTVMVTALLLPQRVSPVVTPDVRGFTVHACVSVHVCLCMSLSPPIPFFFLFIIHIKYMYFFILLVYVCVRGHSGVPALKRCYHSCCLNIPPASSARPQTVALWCVCVRTRVFLRVLATQTCSNGPFSLMH